MALGWIPVVRYSRQFNPSTTRCQTSSSEWMGSLQIGRNQPYRRQNRLGFQRRVCSRAECLSLSPTRPGRCGVAAAWQVKRTFLGILGTLRADLACTVYAGLSERRAWRVEYNTVRPHNSLGYRAPAPETMLPLTACSATLHKQLKANLRNVT